MDCRPLELDLTSPFGTYQLSAWQRIARIIAQKIHWKPLVNLVRQLGSLRSCKIADVNVYGHQFRLLPQQNRCDKLVLGYPHLFDKEERLSIKEFLNDKDAKTFLDIGANIGAYSAYAAFIGASKVVAVEAEPTMFKRLSFNLPDMNIMKLNLAVAEEEGILPFYLHPKNSGENSLVPNDGEKIEVPAKTLKQIITDNFKTAPAVMKIDIEGMEYKVLNKFFEEADVSFYPKMILMEYIHSADVLKLLLENGYEEVKKTKLNVIVVRGDDNRS